MNNILSEKEYQHFIMDRLQENGYIVRNALSYDRLFAMDREMLFKFLDDTQPKTMEYLRGIYKNDLEETVINFINTHITKARGSLLDALKHGIEISNKHDYQVLLVANKYQTGFDQPKLCAMYIMKKLSGVSAVQTLSRLNRICPPYDKKTFILDFVNDYEDIKSAFAPYYTTTLLANTITPTAIYDLEAKIDAYAVIDPMDIDNCNTLLYKEKVDGKDKQKMTFYFKKAKSLIEHYTPEQQNELVGNMRSFVRFYEFLLQVSCFEDVELHKKYNFINCLLSYININHPGGGYNLDGKIKATNFVQKKGEEHKQSNLVSDPIVKLPTADAFGLTKEKEELLSQIIAEINSRTGKSYDNDVAVKAMLQIKDILMKSEKLKISAKNNTEQDFSFSYFDDIDDALMEGRDQNKDFFDLLLKNDEIKHQVLGIFTSEIYKSLREEK